MAETKKNQWRERYLNKEISHSEYYGEFLKHGWYPEFAGFEFDRVAECLRSGDIHLNNIPLHLWDQKAKAYKAEVARANKVLNGESSWSLFEGVCVLKEKARRDTIKRMLETGEITEVPSTWTF